MSTKCVIYMTCVLALSLSVLCTVEAVEEMSSEASSQQQIDSPELNALALLKDKLEAQLDLLSRYEQISSHAYPLDGTIGKSRNKRPTITNVRLVKSNRG